MAYISVEEAGKSWGISARRVRVLCQENRIQNAKIIGGKWMIPDYEKKPENKKKTKAEGYPKREKLHLLFNIDYCEKTAKNKLTAEDYEYCEISNVYFSGDIEKAYEMSIKFLEKYNKFEYRAVLYMLMYTIALDSGRANQFMEMANKETRLLKENRDLKYTLSVLSMFYNEKVDVDFLSLPEEISAQIAFEFSRTDLMNKIAAGKEYDLGGYEILCNLIDSRDMPQISVYFHCLLALCSMFIGDKKKGRQHQQIASDIAYRRGWVTPLAEYSYSLDWSYLKDTDEEFYGRIKSLGNTCVENYFKTGLFISILPKESKYSLLSVRIGYLISCGKTNTEIADILEIKLYLVKRVLNEIYTCTSLQSRDDIGRYIRTHCTMI